MCQKCEGNYGLWVLNEIIKKAYPENLKKIMGAVWELPAKQHSQFQPNLSENGLDWLCYLAGNYQTAPMIFFQTFRIHFTFYYFIKNSQTTIALTFLTYIISVIGGV